MKHDLNSLMKLKEEMAKNPPLAVEPSEPSVALKKRKRKPGAGRKRKEPTTVVRIPTALVTAVNWLLERYKKGEPLFPESPAPQPVASQTITHDLPLPTPPERKKPDMKYLMVVDGINHYWSGRGRPPMKYIEYMYQYRGTAYEKSCLDKFLI